MITEWTASTPLFRPALTPITDWLCPFMAAGPLGVPWPQGVPVWPEPDSKGMAKLGGGFKQQCIPLSPEGAGAPQIAISLLPTRKPRMWFFSEETEVQRRVTAPKAHRSLESGDSVSFPGTRLCL